jgi:hypothetical protein
MFKNKLRGWGVRASEKDRAPVILSLMSSSYLESYYEREVQCSPSLKEFDHCPPSGKRVLKLSVRLAEYEEKISGAVRRGAYLAIILLVIVLLLTSRNTATARYVQSFGALASYSLILVYTWLVFRLLNEERAVLWLFFAIRELEKTENWQATRFRYGIARRVEHVAKRVERIPLAFRGIAPSVRGDVMKVSKAKAQALRLLEASIIMPSAITRTELIDRLSNDLCSIKNERWYELPEDQAVEQVRSRWIPIVQVSASVLIIGLAIFVPTLAGKVGFLYSSLVAALLLSLGLALLNQAGLSTRYLSDIFRSDGK